MGNKFIPRLKPWGFFVSHTLQKAKAWLMGHQLSAATGDKETVFISKQQPIDMGRA